MRVTPAGTQGRPAKALITALFVVGSLSACRSRPKPSAAPAPERAREQARAVAAPSAAISPLPPPPASALAPSAGPPVGSATRFAAIGDYGVASDAERRVAELVQAQRPDFVITLGDNNYPNGGADTIDENIGRYYASFIHPYRGRYGPGASENRFFPALGNHDWYTPGAAPYLDYFTLPGNERYYDIERGPVHLLAIDSDPNEPDGTSATSIQARWLKERLAASHAAYRIAYMHHPPYSSGPHGSTALLKWPFREWGVDLVLAGHDHDYERFEVDGLTYVVNGLGGNGLYAFQANAPGSTVRYNESYGALFFEARPDGLRGRFLNVQQKTVDEFRVAPH